MSDMPEDLKWLANYLAAWPHPNCPYVVADMGALTVHYACGTNFGKSYNKHQWLQARRDLGLEPSGVSEDDEEECIQLAYERMSKKDDPYSAYFKDVRHINTLDVYRVIDLFGCEKHGHPISHAVKKLLLSGARTGGKDVEADVREAIDSATRWLEMQEENRRAL